MESITLQTNNTIVVAGSRLGQVQFAASAESDSGAARLVAARIFAQGEGAFTSVSNPTSLVFATAGPDANGAIDRLQIAPQGDFIPIVNNQYSIGNPSARFLGSYAVSGIFDELNLTSSNKISSGILYLDNNGLAQTFSNVSVSTADISSPALVFRASGTLTPDISLNVLTTATNVASGVQTLSFRGSAGELFSITDVLNTGTIFSVNDISGLELIAADADGTVRLVKFGTNVAVGNITPTQKLHIAGNLRLEGELYDSLNSPGSSGQVLVSVPGGTDWRELTEIAGVDGTGSSNYVAKWTDSNTIGTGVLYDNGTNVGIGTASPSYKLDINGGQNAFRFTSNTNIDSYLNAASGNSQGFTVYQQNSSNIFRIGFTTLGLGEISLYNNKDFQIKDTSNNQWLYLKDGGNVGIGTTSPTAQLHVNTSSSTATGVIVRGASSQTADLQQWQNSAGTALTRIFADGSISGVASGIFMQRVGIATSNPQANLEVFGTSRFGGVAVASRRIDFGNDGSAVFAFGNDANTSNLILENTFTNATTNHGNNILWRFGTNSSAVPINAGKINLLKEQQWTSTASTRDAYLSIDLSENGTVAEKFRITSEGNIGIGTTSPTARIHAFTSTNRVLGLFQQATSSPTALPVVQISRPNNIFSPTAQSAGLFISEHSANFALHVENHSASPLFTVNGNGNVGIGTTTPTAKLDVRGTGYFSESVRTSGTVVFASGNTGTVGVMQWNDDDGTVDLGLKGGNVTLQIGQENTLLAFNVKGASMSNGEVVSINGAQGQRMSIISAVASGAYIAAHSVGIVTEDIPAGEVGFVTTYGTVRNLNTYIDGLSEGKEIFVSPTTPGGWTTVRPQAPNHAVRIGYIQREHASAGSIFVSVQVGEHLEYLHDVLLTTPSSGDIIRYDSSNGIWKNVSIGSLGLGTVTSIATNNGVTGGTITTTGTIGLTGQALALHNLATNGLIARTGTGTVAGRTITGTSNQVTVTNGDGVAGNPTLSLPQNIHTAATPTFGGATLNGALNLRASATGVAATQIPVFTEDPASTTRLLVTRTPAQILSDIGAQAALTNPVTGVGANGQVSFWTGTNSQEGDTRLIWDNASKRLGIGTTPASDLHVRKAFGGNIVRLGIGAANANGLVSSIEWFTNENVSADYLAGIRTGFSGGVANVNRQIQFMVGDSSTPKAIINGDGNLGIGTSSPTRPLHVAGDIRIGSSDPGGRIEFGGTSNVIYDSGGSLYINQGWSSSNRVFLTSAGAVTVIGDYNNNDSSSSPIFTVQEGNLSGGNTRFLVTKDGNVGIATTGPTARLHINTDAATATGVIVRGAASQSADLQQWQNSAGTVLAEVTASGNLHLRASSTASTATQIPVFIGDPSSTTREIVTRTPAQLRADIGAQAELTNPVTGTGVSGRVSFWTGSTTQGSDANLYWDDANNRLGVGTPTPSRVLEAVGGSDATETVLMQVRSNFTANNTASTIRFANSTDTSAAQGSVELAAIRTNSTSSGDSDLVIRTTAGASTTEKVRVTNAGNVGIGTSSPSTTLHVRNGSSGSSLTNSSTFIVENNGNANNFFAVRFATAGDNNSFCLSNAGNLGLGTDSISAKLHVQNSSAATTGVIVRGAASQSADLQQWQSSAGTVLAEVTAGGNLHFRASSTASAATQIPVFTGDPTSSTREILTRTPTQLRADMGAIDGTGVAGRVSFWSGTSTQSSDTNLFWDNTNKRLGVGTTTPSSDLEVNGDFSAKTKSFVIDHPTKPGKRLRYACLEGPENGVYFRGSTDEDIIKLPDYWHALVDEETITVNLTPVGIYQSLYVKSKTVKEIKVGGLENGAYDFVVYAERKDVSRLEVEC